MPEMSEHTRMNGVNISSPPFPQNKEITKFLP